MIEMELRASLKNKDQVKKKLEEYGCKWVSKGLQVDTIYERKDAQPEAGVPIFRIRKNEGKKILTLKVIMEDIDTAEELELDISDDIIMDKILKYLGFLPKASLVKRRDVTIYGKYCICIDEVDGLGDYIEIEKLSDDSNAKDGIYAEMEGLLLELGIEMCEIKKEKYYQMVLEKQDVSP